VGEPLLPVTVAPMVVSGVVEQEHVAFGADDVAQQLAVVSPTGQRVNDLHAGLDAGQTQDVGGMLELVTLEIRRAAAGMLNGGIVNIGGAYGRCRQAETG